jgi:hypothetical protein
MDIDPDAVLQEERFRKNNERANLMDIDPVVQSFALILSSSNTTSGSISIRIVLSSI